MRAPEGKSNGAFLNRLGVLEGVRRYETVETNIMTIDGQLKTLGLPLSHFSPSINVKSSLGYGCAEAKVKHIVSAARHVAVDRCVLCSSHFPLRMLQLGANSHLQGSNACMPLRTYIKTARIILRTVRE